MRQVSRDELIYKVAAALGAAPAGMLRGLSHRCPDARTQYRVMVAGAIVDRALKSFEVLSDIDLPLMGEQTYSRPLANMLGQEAVPLTYDDPADPLPPNKAV